MNIRLPHGLKVMLIALGWGSSLAALTINTIFQGYLLPTNGGGLLPEVYGANPLGLWIFYLGGLGISTLAALIINDAGPAILAFFVSYGLCAFLTVIVLALPELVGIVQSGGVLSTFAVLHTFPALFPVAFLVNLVGMIVGIALGEQLLYASVVS